MKFHVGLRLLLFARRFSALFKSSHSISCHVVGGRGQVFLVGYVEERPRWLIQSPNKGRKKKAKG